VATGHVGGPRLTERDGKVVGGGASCTGCGRTNPDTAAFCGGCGRPMATRRPCPGCGSDNHRSNVFCHGCGRRLEPAASTAPVGQRRFLTVVFADLVGSTALSVELDPEDMRDLVLAYQAAAAAAIEVSNGFIAHYLGDGILAYFGFPSAHEDDARLAVRAGLDIVAAAEPLRARFGRADLAVRVGIHSGEVVISDMGTGDRLQQDDVVGEVPNMAARLQAAGSPGSVVISGATAELVSGWFAAQDLGPLDVKGVPQPVRAYRVTGPTTVGSPLEASAARGLTPLVGRDEELRALRAAWGVAHGGGGRVVAVRGEAGIGKSRLVQELRDHVATDGGASIRLSCSPYRSSTALYPVTEYLEKVIGTGGGPDDRLDRLEKQLRELDLPVAIVGPLLAELLSIPWSQRWTPSTDSPERRKRLTFEALLAWLLAGTADRPLLLIVEDIHWIDPTTQELLERFFAPHPVAGTLLVVTHRSPYDLPWPDRPYVQRMVLDRLSADEVLAIVEALAGGKPLPADVTAQIADRTDGVPLFAEEVTHAVLESGVVQEGEDAWVATGALPDGLVPMTLRESLMARLDRLGEAKQLAQLMAVVGRRVDDDFLRAVANADGPTLDGLLHHLLVADLIHRRQIGDRVSYEFKHWLVRDVAYGSLLRSTRRDDHLRIAQLMISGDAGSADEYPEMVAHHLEAAGRPEEAVPFLAAAGERAYQGSAHVEAIRHLSHALELLRSEPPSTERDQRELLLLIGLGAPLTASEGYGAPSVEAAYSRAGELCRALGGHAPALFRALYGTWRVHLLRADYTESLDFATELLAIAARGGDPVQVTAANRAAGSTLFYLGADLRRALHHLDTGIEVGASVDRRRWLVDLQDVVDPWITCHAYRAWVLWLLGDRAGAEATSERCRTLAEESQHPFTIALSLSFDSWLRQFLGDPEAVRDRASRALALAEEQGFPFWIGWARIMCGWAQAQLGEAAAGIAAMRRGLSEWRELHSELGSTYFLTLLAETLVEAGRLEEAEVALADAVAVAEHRAEAWWEPEILRWRGRLAERNGDRAGAAGFYEQALASARARGAAPLADRAAASLLALEPDQTRPGPR
jgi:class 3 adenylate cyclase/predicted ATPase